MPPITLPKAPPIAGLRDIQRPEEVAPRADYATGGRANRADALDLQAVQAAAESAGELVGFGQQLQDQAAKLMEPFEKLRQGREVMMAQGIALEAQLIGREQVQSIRSSGIPYTEWLPQATQQLQKTFMEATKRAEAISPAAGIEVTQQLQQEQLSLLSGVQTEAIRADLNTQYGIYQIKRATTEADYLRTPDGVKRAEMEENVMKMARYMGAIGAISEAAARKEMVDITKSFGKLRILEEADRNGLMSAVEVAKKEPNFDLDDQRVAINAATDLLQTKEKESAKADERARRQLGVDQDATYAREYDIVSKPGRTLPEYETDRQRILKMSQTPVKGNTPGMEIEGARAAQLLAVINASIKQREADTALLGQNQDAIDLFTLASNIDSPPTVIHEAISVAQKLAKEPLKPGQTETKLTLAQSERIIAVGRSTLAAQEARTKEAVQETKQYTQEQKRDIREAITFKQDQAAVTLMDEARRPGKSIAEYEALRARTLELYRTPQPLDPTFGGLSTAQTDSILSTVDGNIVRLRAGPAPEYHDPRRENTLVTALQLDPLSVDILSIDQETIINSASKEKLKAYRKSLLVENSFRKTLAFNNTLELLAGFHPKDRGFAMSAMGGAPHLAAKLAEIRAAYIMYIYEASRATEGVLTEAQVLEANKQILPELRKSVENMKLSDFINSK